MLKIVISILLSSATCLYSQKESSDSQYRFNTGVLWSNIGYFLGGQMNYEFNRHVISFSGNYTGEFENLIEKEPLLQVYDIGVLYGRSIKPFNNSDLYFVSVSGGIGYTGGVLRGKYLREESFIKIYEKNKISTIGALIELQSYWILSKNFGIGSTFHININKSKTIYAYMIGIQVGKLR